MFGIRTRIRNRVHQRFRDIVASTPTFEGGDGTAGFRSRDRVHVAPNVNLNNAVLNVNGGSITIGEYAFLGSGVSLLTGTHDPTLRGRDRALRVPHSGRDIVIEAGVWIASNATIIGPCRIGADAVVAAGALVTKDVQPGEIVGGVPARHLSWIEFADR
jgi:acetyltransferase-like isoleucine patch superfamily enzyme